jgi:hypothetical protein
MPAEKTINISRKNYERLSNFRKDGTFDDAVGIVLTLAEKK